MANRAVPVARDGPGEKLARAMAFRQPSEVSADNWIYLHHNMRQFAEARIIPTTVTEKPFFSHFHLDKGAWAGLINFQTLGLFTAIKYCLCQRPIWMRL
jgi:hypothetical protein